jgi:hypothetical protein
MHDPMTVAFEIKNPFSKAKYPDTLITIWHVDPEKDGTDDSCGWFIRSRHLDPTLMEKVRKEFAFNFKHNYWFNDAGYPKFSVIAITLEMYSHAAWIIFMHQNNENPDRKRHSKFMKKHLYDILHFAENPTDSLHSSITMHYGVESQEERIRHFASIVTADIFRKERKWWQHPRWHIHHWKIQFHPWQRFKRRYLDKCCKCGKRGFTGPAYSDWHGTRIWCDKCEQATRKPSPVNQ